MVYEKRFLLHKMHFTVFVVVDCYTVMNTLLSTWPEKKERGIYPQLFYFFLCGNHSYFSDLRALAFHHFFCVVFQSNWIIFNLLNARGGELLHIFLKLKKWWRFKLTLLAQVINYDNYYDVFPVLLKRDKEDSFE